ncbi:MAG TPA: hypothetical protein VGL59_04940 [Polyangia bacterium]
MSAAGRGIGAALEFSCASSDGRDRAALLCRRAAGFSSAGETIGAGDSSSGDKTAGIASTAGVSFDLELPLLAAERLAGAIAAGHNQATRWRAYRQPPPTIALAPATLISNSEPITTGCIRHPELRRRRDRSLRRASPPRRGASSSDGTSRIN